MNNPIRKRLKTADIIAGAIAVLLALPNLNIDTPVTLEHIVLIALVVIALPAGWYVAQGKYWMLKIFLYSGIMLLFLLIARLLFSLAYHIYP